MAQDTVRPDHHYLLQMNKFPCTFNLDSIGKITLSRLRYVRHNLISELEIGVDSKEELVRKTNLLTLVEFRLGDRRMAQELNDEVVHLTNWTNISSLGNRCFIMVSLGDEPEAKVCLMKLKKLRKCHEMFDDLLTEAIAEQAYCYSRLGGSDNLKLAINLFTLAVAKRPDNYLWKFGLGLVYRRATHINMYCSNPQRIDVEQFKKMAADYLFDVGENASSSNLRAMAYAQIVKLRQDHASHLFHRHDSLFHHFDIQQLCDKALEFGRDIPCVLTQCGRSLKNLDLDKAIDLLQKSVTIKRNTIAYHHLGICYKRKAELLAQEENIKTLCETEVLGVGLSSPARWGNARVISENVFNEPGLAQLNRTGNQIVPFLKHFAINTEYLDQRKVNQSVFTSNYINTDFCQGFLVCRCPSQKFHQSLRQLVRSASCECIENQSMKLSTGQITNSEMLNSRHDMYLKQSVRLDEHNQRLATAKPQDPAPLYSRSISKDWSPQDEVKAFVASTVMSVSLDRNDKLVQKAISCFKCAIELSNGENLPAILDLGIILKQTGQVREALTQFNSVTNSLLSLTGHRLTVICAYEQAGLCYLELSKSDRNDNSFEKDGQKKLTKAISLAADLAITIAELKNCARDVWTSFKTLLNELDNRNTHSANQIKQKIKLLELVQDYGQIIEVVQTMHKFSDEELIDRDIIQTTLKSFLNLGQPENALAFQNMIGIRREIRDSNWWTDEQMIALRSKVLLHTLSEQLVDINENPTYLFQQLFKLCYGCCMGGNVCKKDQQNMTSSTKIGDVLIVFDEDQDTVEGPSVTMTVARYITQLSTCLFGLEANENLQGTGEYGDLLPIQLKEMAKYQVVILVLGSETRNPQFEATLERVSYSMPDQEFINHRILVIDAGLREGQVPLCLKPYPCCKLADIGSLGEMGDQGQIGDLKKIRDLGEMRDLGNIVDNGGVCKSFDCYTEIVQHCGTEAKTRDLYKDFDAILKLFCFIIGKQWPCP